MNYFKSGLTTLETRHSIKYNVLNINLSYERGLAMSCKCTDSDLSLLHDVLESFIVLDAFDNEGGGELIGVFVDTIKR